MSQTPHAKILLNLCYTVFIYTHIHNYIRMCVQIGTYKWVSNTRIHKEGMNSFHWRIFSFQGPYILHNKNQLLKKYLIQINTNTHVFGHLASKLHYRITIHSLQYSTTGGLKQL